MSDKLPTRVLDAIYRSRWAIMPETLETIIEIASRRLSDKEAVLSTPAVRRESGNLNVRDGVGIINVGGVIVPHANFYSEWSGGTSVDTLGLRFGEAMSAPDVRAIVLHIDSPGGNITGINEFTNQIYGARGKGKPIHAYISGTGASAAYWIASAADKIFADKTAQIGSIGVVASWDDYSEADEKRGIKHYEIVSSQSPDKRLDPKSKEGRAKLQRELDSLADIFIESVARNRDTNSVFVQDNYGKGGIMLAEDAIKVGMADSLGSLEEIIHSLSKGESFMATANDVLAKKRATSMAASASKAEDKPDDEEEEDEEKDTQEKTEGGKEKDDKEDKKAALVAKKESARLEAICAVMATYGYSDLVKKAIFDKSISAEKLELDMIKADTAARGKLWAAIQQDAAVMDGVAASTSDSSEERNTDGIVNAMVEGLKIGGCKEVRK